MRRGGAAAGPSRLLRSAAASAPRPSVAASPLSIRRVGGKRNAVVYAGVEAGDFVRVHYTGTLADGSEFDSSRGRGPLEFVVGSSNVIEGFHDLVMGLGTGEKRTRTIEAKKAYGEWSEDLVAKVPASQAPDGLKKGAAVQLSNGMVAAVTDMDDEFITLDANHQLAGKDLTFEVELVSSVPKSAMETVTFGAGCFWGVELAFQRIPGVLSTQVGYCQGSSEQTTYEEVCSGQTGHVEVVQVQYDPKTVTLDRLFEVFFDRHDPTQLNRQGNDVGTQYRSGIYVSKPERVTAAKEAIQKVQAKHSDPVVTEVEEIRNYCPAETYHQQYLARGGRFGRPQSAAKGCNDPIRCYG